MRTDNGLGAVFATNWAVIDDQTGGWLRPSGRVVATKRAGGCDQAGGRAVATKRAVARKCVLLAGYGWWLLGVEPKQASDSAIPVALGNRIGCDQTGGGLP
jgi:hypothetical protein